MSTRLSRESPHGVNAGASAYTDGRQSGRAWGDVGAQLRFWLIALAGVALDLVSKAWAFRTLGQGGRRVLVPGVLEFQTMVNDGALFGIGGGQTTVFLVASALALVLVICMFAYSPARNRVLHLALAAILAGAVGNTYDRAFVRLTKWRDSSGPVRYYVKSFSPDGQRIWLREYPPRPGPPQRELPARADEALPAPVGYVRDFIKISAQVFGGRELWPWVFNVADMLLVGGVGVLAVRLWFERDPGRPRRGHPDLLQNADTASS